jgi:putative membrane protein
MVKEPSGFAAPDAPRETMAVATDPAAFRCPPSQPMSYLDDPRVFFAAERTMLAWQRTAIALMGLGFVIERFGLFMRMLVAGGAQPASGSHTSLIFGVMLLVIGALVALVSALQFSRFLKELSASEIPRGYATWFGPFVNIALAVIALGLAAWFVVTA